MSEDGVLLDVKNLCVYFSGEEGIVRAVEDVSFQIPKGKMFALVGESGCGKSVTALSILRLIRPPGEIVRGDIIFDSEELLKFSEKQMRRIRGKRISMIFQDPRSSLNPVYPAGEQVAEVIRLHRARNSDEGWAQAVQILRKVGINDAEERACAYPHQLSGGMCQRVMIAMAVCCEPELLIADEPTTSLDVTVQAQILALLESLRAERGMSVLLLSHDLSVVAERADEVAVMYASRIVETCGCKQLFRDPLHPYTRILISAIPNIRSSKKRIKENYAGEPPSNLNPPRGCPFNPRCPVVQKR
jgi:peptide/nickel transport system ATP-binding protein